MSHYVLTLNERLQEIETDPATSLLSVLRDDLGLTGTHFGCGYGACGACVVLLDGKAVPACSVPASEAAGKAVVTIEGLSGGDGLHPVQQAFLDEDAMQCGDCTSGMIMSAVALLERNSRPTEEEIRTALSVNLCRCGVYTRAIRAVQRASERMTTSDTSGLVAVGAA